MMRHRSEITLILFLVLLAYLDRHDYSEYHEKLSWDERAHPFAPRLDTQSASYRIVDKHFLSYDDPIWQCIPSRESDALPHRTRAPLHPSFQSLTNFSTTLSLTSIRILVMGDSVAMQMYHMLEMAVGASEANRTVLADAVDVPGRYAYALSSTATVGAWKITDIFQRANEGKPPPNAKGGGWSYTMARNLLNLPDPINGEPIGSFDVIFFIIPSAWLVADLPDFKASRIIESLQLANEVFGVTKAILLTMPFQTDYDYDSLPILLEKNRDLHSLATTFQPNRTIPGITGLAIMDFAKLHFSMIRLNAFVSGYSNSTNSSDMPYLKIRLHEHRQHNLAALVCAGPVISTTAKAPSFVNMTTCVKNSLLVDHVHICPDVFGGRIVAATGCLLQCLYDRSTTIIDHHRGNTNGDETNDMGQQVTSLACQKECNDKFMSFSENPTLASNSVARPFGT